MNVLDKVRKAEQEADQMLNDATEAAAAALQKAKADQKTALQSKVAELASEKETVLKAHESDLEEKAAATVKDGQEAAATITASFAAKKSELMKFVKENI